jgi:hypothetical protein
MVNRSEIRSTTRVNPVNVCIYCGHTQTLSDEHVVPFALGGHLVLPKASCGSCASITSGFERQVLRGFMLNARATGQFPTRRPKQRPKSIPLEVKRGDRVESIDLPLSESLGLLQLPRLQPCSFLAGRPPVNGAIIVGLETIGFGKPPEDVAANLGAKELTDRVTVDVPAFVRMLAKIGYSYAVASHGPYPLSEVPVLPLILGNVDDGSTWVGSSEYLLDVEAERPAHALGLVASSTVINNTAEQILVARVKLFASSGATGYEVVVRRSRVPQTNSAGDFRLVL